MADVTTLFIKVDSKGVVTASKSLNGLYKQSVKTKKGVDGLTTSTVRFNNATTRSRATLAEASSGLKTVGRDLTRYSLLMAGAAAAITKFSFDLSKGMGTVQALIPQTGDRIFELEQAVKDLSISSGVGFANLTEGLYQTISAFQDSADAVDIFTQATKAAVGGGSSIADAIELASAVTKAYGDTSAEATQKVFDLAAETVRLGQTTFPQLANGIQTATDSAVRLGVSQEELFATFSSLTGVIGDASEVATKFRSVSASLLNPNANLLDLFERLEKATGKQVTTGKDFVAVMGGMTPALKLIIDTATDSDQPLQSYIRRIEGITIASRLSGASAEKYASDLNDMNNVAGASIQTFKEVREGIDKFRQSILSSKQQIAVVATEIGENLIPRLDDMFKRIAFVADAFAQLDVDIQNTIINFGVLLVVAGPALILFGSIARAIKGIMALKSVTFFATLATTLGPLGLAGALLVLAGLFLIINKIINDNIAQQKKLAEGISLLNAGEKERAKSLINTAEKYEGMTDQQDINRHLNEALIEQYPLLSKVIDINATKVADLEEAFSELNANIALAAAPDLYEDQIKEADKFANTVQFANDRLEEARKNQKRLTDLLLIDPENARNLFDLGEVDAMIAKLGSMKKEAFAAGEALATEIDLTANTQGIDAYFVSTGLGFRKLIDDGKDFSDDLDGIVTPPGIDPATSTKALKTWQEWFEDVTGIAKETFGNSGEIAAQRFVDALTSISVDKSTFDDLIGLDTDELNLLEDELKSLESAVLKLVAIPKEEIAGGEAFLFADKSISGLLVTAENYLDILGKLKGIKFFNEVQKDIQAIDELAVALGELPQSFDTLTAQEGILKDAIEDALSLENLDTQILDSLKEQLASVQEAIINTFEGAKESVKDFVDIITEDLFNAFMSIDGLPSSLALQFSEMAESIASMAGQLAVSGIEDFGFALAQGADAGESFQAVLADMAAGILAMLPMLFIQAGLQMIAQGNTALGLGFIAAGLTSSFINGLSKGATESATENANGNAFSEGNIIPFAAGGTFTNTIVKEATPFKFGGQLGVMGEAGDEAILPLTRTSSGNLGVETSGMGGTTNVSIKIINNTGENVETIERSTSDGKEIEIIIGRVVNAQLSNGKFDKSMNNRYGTKVKGISA